MKYLKYIIPVFVIVFLFLTNYTLVFGQDIDPDSSTGKLIILLDDISILLWVVGLGIGLILIIVSGIMYMTAGGDETKVTKAKKTLIYTLIGVAIVIAANFILNMISDFLINRGMGGAPGT